MHFTSEYLFYGHRTFEQFFFLFPLNIFGWVCVWISAIDGWCGGKGNTKQKMGRTNSIGCQVSLSISREWYIRAVSGLGHVYKMKYRYAAEKGFSILMGRIKEKNGWHRFAVTLLRFAVCIPVLNTANRIQFVTHFCEAFARTYVEISDRGTMWIYFFVSYLALNENILYSLFFSHISQFFFLHFTRITLVRT